MKKRFEVQAVVRGTCTLVVWAENEEEAINKLELGQEEEVIREVAEIDNLDWDTLKEV